MVERSHSDRNFIRLKVNLRAAEIEVGYLLLNCCNYSAELLIDCANKGNFVPQNTKRFSFFDSYWVSLLRQHLDISIFARGIG